MKLAIGNYNIKSNNLLITHFKTVHSILQLRKEVKNLSECYYMAVLIMQLVIKKETHLYMLQLMVYHSFHCFIYYIFILLINKKGVIWRLYKR